MYEIRFENDDMILKFPRRLFSTRVVQKFLDQLKFESVAEKSELSEEDVWILSEKLKRVWWEKNKTFFEYSATD